MNQAYIEIIIFAYCIIGYIVGSIPFGHIIVKLKKGVDIRTLGSGNIGATNVGRILGWPWGVLCFLLDAGKGFIPVAFVIINYFNINYTNLTILSYDYSSGFISCHPLEYYDSVDIGMYLGLGVIIGHMFPIYIGFKGGKGVATGLGVFLALAPISTIIAFIIWVIFLWVFGYVSLASIVAAITLPLSYWSKIDYKSYDIVRNAYFNEDSLWGESLKVLFNYHNAVFIFCIIVAALIIYKHIPNIKRLIAGTEPKVKLWGAKPQINTDEHK